MDQNKWCLVVNGVHEIFGTDGYPIDYFEYETYFYFKELKTLLDFVSVHQENATQFHKYNISFD